MRRTPVSTNTPITLRLDTEAVQKLKVVATVQDRTINDILREVIAGYLTEVTSEPEFEAKLNQSLKRMRDAVRPASRGGD
jgi:predicted DNA-binding protein